MADFAMLGVAAEQALGWPRDSFADAYDDNRQDAHTIALDESPIAKPLVKLAHEGEWSGTAEQLLEELTRRVGETAAKSRQWPKSPRALSGRLRRLAPNLKAVGITLTFALGGPRGKSRIISLCADGADGADGTKQGCSYGEDVRTPFG
jgi:hypothetical protein